jgi:hypothetical protein
VSAITDEHGRYRIEGLPGATYHVTVYAGGAALERDGVGVSTLDPTTLDVAIDAGAVVFSSGDMIENTYIVGD